MVSLAIQPTILESVIKVQHNTQLPSWCSLGLLARKVADARLQEITESLCQRVVSGKKEQQRDIASIGLKTVIAEVPAGSHATVLVGRMTPFLIEGISKQVRACCAAATTPGNPNQPDQQFDYCRATWIL